MAENEARDLAGSDRRGARAGAWPSRAGRSRPALVAAALAAFIAASPAAADTPNEFPARENLSANEVRRVVRQAVAEAEAQGAAATIAVTDRVGNVLAVYVMDGADTGVRIPGLGKVDPRGLNGLRLPAPAATLAVISKAITGAYLSSNGNAFSTRTASQIVQENFNPGSETLEGGPLFGVQFSSLPCSDLNTRFESNNGGLIDPRVDQAAVVALEPGVEVGAGQRGELHPEQRPAFQGLRTRVEVLLDDLARRPGAEGVAVRR
ncbi:MAG TPA: heme-binding protein, partial [Geminicoccaceae bacterium]